MIFHLPSFNKKRHRSTNAGGKPQTHRHLEAELRSLLVQPTPVVSGTYGGFLKWWVSPTIPWVFLLKMIGTWGGDWGYHYLRKHPHGKKYGKKSCGFSEVPLLMIQKSDKKAPVKVGSFIALFATGFIHPRWLARCLNHQQYLPFSPEKYTLRN